MLSEKNMISVIIPAYNEEGVVPETVCRAQTVRVGAGAQDFEVVEDDNGSTVRAGQVTAENGAVVIRHSQKSGCHKVVGARTGNHFREWALKTPLRAMLKALVDFLGMNATLLARIMGKDRETMRRRLHTA
jgi:polyisoprenyl-phosphate glycosyltransferase